MQQYPPKTMIFLRMVDGKTSPWPMGQTPTWRHGVAVRGASGVCWVGGRRVLLSALNFVAGIVWWFAADRSLSLKFYCGAGSSRFASTEGGDGRAVRLYQDCCQGCCHARAEGKGLGWGPVAAAPHAGMNKGGLG